MFISKLQADLNNGGLLLSNIFNEVFVFPDTLPDKENKNNVVEYINPASSIPQGLKINKLFFSFKVKLKINTKSYSIIISFKTNYLCS